jgi:glycosyltransferase involved in cell wall biosynthesis
MHKKILVITDNLPEQINGVVTTFKNLEAPAILDGYSIVYLDPREFIHFSCPGYSEVKLAIPWNIGEKIEEISPDHIHIATEGPIGLFARLYLDLRGYRYNTSYHTKFPEFLNTIYKIPLSMTYAYLRWFHKHSGNVLTTTPTMVNELRDKKFKGNIVSWTRGVDREYLKPSRDWPHPNPEPLLLYVGRISKEKSVEDVCQLSSKYNVVIVGDGPYRIELEKKYPLVNFVGYQTGSNLADWYSRADVFVFPSRADTFGIVIIEALSLGTPVAAYPVSGPRDIVDIHTGSLNEDLFLAVEQCLTLDRAQIKESSKIWNWPNCWDIFKNNLVAA